MVRPTADRPARVSDIHQVAAAMPCTTRAQGPLGNVVYQVGGKSFVIFRNPRRDAKDLDTGEPYPDVIVIWVEGESDKSALVQDPDTPFFTTDHFAGHPSVLVRASELGRVPRSEIVELIQDAWLCQASKRRATAWLAQQESS